MPDITWNPQPQGLRRAGGGGRREHPGAGRDDPLDHRHNGAEQDHLLQPAERQPGADGLGGWSTRAGHQRLPLHRSASASAAPSDHQSFPQPDRAGRRASGCRAQQQDNFAFLRPTGHFKQYEARVGILNRSVWPARPDGAWLWRPAQAGWASSGLDGALLLDEPTAGSRRAVPNDGADQADPDQRQDHRFGRA